MDMQHQPDSHYIDQLKEYERSSRRMEEYAKTRLDLLTVSISGAGLYVCLETLRFLLGSAAPAMPEWPVKLAGALFTLAIAVNFLGQHAGAKVNEVGAALGRLLANLEQYGDNSRREADDLEARRARYNTRVHRANRTATALMLAGVVALLGAYITCL